ncbi:hypothetical protein FVW27_13990, partial [Desulfovibrio sp. XJ01]|nr:hypothetical protein [Nitratidesulfovibrio liaohensis]
MAAPQGGGALPHSRVRPPAPVARREPVFLSGPARGRSRRRTPPDARSDQRADMPDHNLPPTSDSSRRFVLTDAHRAAIVL